MNTETALRLLKNAGFHILGTDGSFIYLEDPSCILRSFETFIEYAWTAIFFITGMLLFGWAMSMIRGAKNDLINNIRNLMLIFGTLTLAVPIMNLIYGDNLFARGCRTIRVAHNDVERVLDARSAQLTPHGGTELYDDIEIIDGNPDQSPIMVATQTVETISSTPGAPTAPSITPPQGTSHTSMAVSAAERGGDVVYTDATGHGIRRTGGTRSWRNQNPGNIRDSKFARRMGAIGAAGGFAVFPDAETGMRAIAALLRSDSYKNLRIADAVARYAPPSENDTTRYQQNLAKLTGLDINIYVRDLSDAQMTSVTAAIRQIEGWTPGREIAQ